MKIGPQIALPHWKSLWDSACHSQPHDHGFQYLPVILKSSHWTKFIFRNEGFKSAPEWIFFQNEKFPARYGYHTMYKVDTKNSVSASLPPYMLLLTNLHAEQFRQSHKARTRNHPRPGLNWARSAACDKVARAQGCVLNPQKRCFICPAHRCTDKQTEKTNQKLNRRLELRSRKPGNYMNKILHTLYFIYVCTTWCWKSCLIMRYIYLTSVCADALM